ncbi:hypothetical protein QTP70_004544 [Hemibagrus guttatus]|uniref:Uncharacterized protein n=1 Tax=Hemibagrus guttatus TaxID=175788 RepID=A0AAE0V054_9TELE|nr:hypothetical protein QTP70_004544 [Hemibagrus guttatus]
MSKTVTHRMSAGFITASVFSTSVDNDCELSGLRRNNAAGLRAVTCTTGSDASRDSLRSIVVTPDSIPQFTIPKLEVEERYTQDRETQPGEDTAWKPPEDLTSPLYLSSSSSFVSSSSSSSLFSSSPALGRKARRSISDPDNHRRISARCSPCTFTESDQCSDPATRGALSLPHLAKITTPYGFVTLSQSPQMASEEELFLQAGPRSWARAKKYMTIRNLRVETESSSSGRALPVQSHPHADSQQVSRAISSSESSVCSGSFPSPADARRPKQSFCGGLRKYLSSQKLTKSI